MVGKERARKEAGRGEREKEAAGRTPATDEIDKGRAHNDNPPVIGQCFVHVEPELSAWGVMAAGLLAVAGIMGRKKGRKEL